MPPVEDDKLLDAISTAVEEARPADARAAEEEADDDATADPPASGEPGPGAQDPPDPQAAAGDEGKDPKEPPADPEADRGDGRNASGRFAKKQGETDADLEKRRAADTADPKGKKPDAPAIDPKTGKPAAAAAPKKADHVNDPIPDTLKKETRERMVGLVSTVKAVTTERDALKEQLGTFTQAIIETGAPPEVFARHVEVLRMMNSDDPREQQHAVKALRAAADKIAGELGEPLPGKDPLEGHQDLIDEVEDGDLTRERALEIAKGRNREKALEARDGRRSEQDEKTRKHEEAIESARTELNTVGAELKKADPGGYAWKTARLVPKIKEMVRDLHPSKWAAHYRQQYALYDGMQAPARVADGGKQRVPRGTGAQQPMRPKQGAGGAPVAEPKSLAEAIDFGIANAARR